jgi:hypothetical protein
MVQSTRDGIFALFGATLTREDHPQRALHAALEMQQALRGYGGKLETWAGGGLGTRIGI